MATKFIKFIQDNSPDGGFLQSEEWRKFQEAVGRKTYNITEGSFWANVIEHKLPIVGRYLYVPRGPVISHNTQHIAHNIDTLIKLAEKNDAGWIRIEPANEENLEIIKKFVENAHVHSKDRNAYMRSLQNYKIVKAPHDMQPREILVMGITKSEEEILAGMKPKTRYNIKLAEKKGVKIVEDRKYADEFIRLTKIMAKRQGISAHPDEYYQKMIEIIPDDMLKLYAAEYQGKIIAANLISFYGNTATYLHGASDDDYRNVMAPQLLQWRQIQDAKRAGCEKYDFGGVKSQITQHITHSKNNSWEGITRFKTGFAPNAKPVEFPGSYDIILAPSRYGLYRIIQKIKSMI
jgi:peptidoglycan pentaglycine glycine transferase (the first glycine)